MNTEGLHDVLGKIEAAMGEQDEESRAALRRLEAASQALSQVRVGEGADGQAVSVRPQDLPKLIESLQRRLDDLESRTKNLDPASEALVRKAASTLLEPRARMDD